MNKEVIVMIYKAFLRSRFVKCECSNKSYQITYVEGEYKTDIYLDFSDAEPKINISQEYPRYPIYDLNGNVVRFGV